MDKDNIKEIFAFNLKTQMALHQISGNDIAEKIGVTKGMVSQWLHCASMPRMDKVYKLCELFDCTVSALITEQEDNVNLDALEEEIVSRFRQLNNSKKMAAFRSFDAILRGLGV